MRPSQVKDSVRHLMSKNRPGFIWGAYGVGKSDIVAEIAKEDGLEMIDFRLAMRDPTDIKGFPMPDAKTKTMKFYRDGELPTSGKGILFMDELNSAVQATQAAAMQLTLSGQIGDYVLPEGWSIIAAGNRESDRSVVHRMPAALAARFVHMDLEVSLDDWCTWAVDAQIDPLMVAFLRFRPGLLHAQDTSARSSPNPRGWSFVDEICDGTLNKDIELSLISGIVGEGAAGEFSAFQRVWKEMPSIDAIMLTPDTSKVPTSPATLFALSTALGARAKKDTFDRAMIYINRMPIEYQVVAVRDSVRKTNAVASTKAFLAWGIANAAVTM